MVWVVFMVSLQPISATSAYPLLPSRVVSICDLQRLALCWFCAPGLQLDNEVLQSADQPRGTVCHQATDHSSPFSCVLCSYLPPSFCTRNLLFTFLSQICFPCVVWSPSAMFVCLSTDVDIITVISTYCRPHQRQL